VTAPSLGELYARWRQAEACANAAGSDQAARPHLDHALELEDQIIARPAVSVAELLVKLRLLETEVRAWLCGDEPQGAARLALAIARPAASSIELRSRFRRLEAASVLEELGGEEPLYLVDRLALSLAADASRLLAGGDLG
jgi:hypothetical protein